MKKSILKEQKTEDSYNRIENINEMLRAISVGDVFETIFLFPHLTIRSVAHEAVLVHLHQPADAFELE